MNRLNIATATNRSIFRLPRFTTQHLPLLGLVCCLALASNPLVAVEAPPEVTTAASNGLPSFLAKVPAESKQLYGFAEDVDFSKVRLASPLLLYTIKPSALSSNQVNDTVSSVAFETSMWFFPVLIGTEVKAMLVVDRQDNEWKAVSLGYAPLAREWHQVCNQWPLGKGFHPRLVAGFQAAQFYFTVPEVGDQNLTPLLSPRNTGPSAKSLPLASEQGLNRYSILSNCSGEMNTLRTLLKTADLKTDRQP
jgi:hypothetical protein